MKSNIVLYLALLVACFNLSGCSDVNSNLEQTSTPVQHPVGYVNKETFKGKWALKSNEAVLKCVNINGLTTGAIAEIDDKEFALTRNIENMEFLPLHYWADAPTEDIGTFKNVCSDVMIDNNTCKVSLYDMVQYADKLCK